MKKLLALLLALLMLLGGAAFEMCIRDRHGAAHRADGPARHDDAGCGR